LTVQNVQQIAMEWMVVADLDQNGYLDKEEFSTFFN